MGGVFLSANAFVSRSDGDVTKLPRDFPEANRAKWCLPGWNSALRVIEMGGCGIFFVFLAPHHRMVRRTTHHRPPRRKWAITAHGTVAVRHTKTANVGQIKSCAALLACGGAVSTRPPPISALPCAARSVINQKRSSREVT